MILFNLIFLLSTFLILGLTSGDIIEQEIIKIADQFSDLVDFTKKPCNDFYSFVCKNFTRNRLKNFPEPSRELFEKILFNQSYEAHFLDSELKLKQFYVSCQTTRSVDDLKSSHLYKISGGWPAVENHHSRKRRSHHSWIEILTPFHDIGIQYFFKHKVEIKSNKRILELFPDTSQRYTLSKYEQIAENVLLNYEVNPGTARLIGLEFIDLERKRRQTFSKNNDSSSDMTYEEFKREIFAQQNIDWDLYFRKVLGKIPKNSDNVRIYRIEELRRVISLLSKTKITQLQNYLWINYLIGKGRSNCHMLAKEFFKPVYQHVMQRFLLNNSQIAKIFSEIGQSYENILPLTPWIDEITHEKSKQFLGEVIHSTLYSDNDIDSDYLGLVISEKNFYRNLEKCQRFIASSSSSSSSLNNFSINTEVVNEFLKILVNILSYYKIDNLSTSLQYAMVGEIFAEHLISGGTVTTPGSWRSSDSDHEFSMFSRCIQEQENVSDYLVENIVLKVIAHSLARHTYKKWELENVHLIQNLNRILLHHNASLNLSKIYFIGTVLMDCGEEREVINSYLRNSKDFIRTFNCEPGEQLYPAAICPVL